ncbi:MAG: thioredoxin domain-containing protein [Anaerolineae bacterium]|nr:thioredoxin domain-containing protein [Anaerolineae bacterium]
MAIPIITDQNFEQEVRNSQTPVLVYFYADGVASCKQVAPEVEAAAKDLEGKAKVVKINIDQSKRITAALRVQTTPTFVAFNKGRPIAQHAGVLRRYHLCEMVEPILASDEGENLVPEDSE